MKATPFPLLIESVLPLLSERFTCFLLNTRGRGPSGEHPDHSPERLMEDITASVESIDEPVGLVESGSFVGASWSLVVARNAPSVIAVAAYDPLVLEVASEQDAARIDGVFERVGGLAAEGRLAEAARRFVEGMSAHGYYTREDMAEGATFDFWGASASNIPMFLNELQLAQYAVGPDPGDPAELARTTAPVLLLHGARSHPINLHFVQHVADHVADPHVRGIPGVGHYGPHTHAEGVAEELASFFKNLRVPA